MKATFCGQFKCLFFAHLKMKTRPIWTIFVELSFSIFLVVITVVPVQYLEKNDIFPKIVSPPAYQLTKNQLFSGRSHLGAISVAPSEPGVWWLMNSTVEILASAYNTPSDTIDIRYFQSEETMLNAYLANSSGVGAGIVFKYNGGQLANYAIRVPYSEAPDTTSWITEQSQCRGGTGLDSFNCEVNKYISNGFTVLQMAINTALIKGELNVSNFQAPTIWVQMMPKPGLTPESTTPMDRNFYSLYIAIAYIPLIGIMTSKLMVNQKMKVTMKMMGLRTYAFWLSWLIIYFVILTVLSAVITVIIVTSNFLTNSNGFILFLILLLYGLSLLTMSCVITTFFDDPGAAGAVAGILALVFSCMYYGVSLATDVSPGVWWFLCLISPVALPKAIDQALFLDQRFNNGMQFSSMTVGDFPLLAPMLLMFLDCILYFFLAIYLDNLFQDLSTTDDGCISEIWCTNFDGFEVKHQPWYCLMKSYWLRKLKPISPLLAEWEFSDVWEENVEPVNDDFRNRTAIRVTDICKQFKSSGKIVNAVNGVSLDIYEGQITCLLGHNGAGKTTLIKMLTGMIPPSSGGASILGLDICNDKEMNQIRSMTGVCQQHNALFKELTPWEHLMLFGGIKGFSGENLEKMCETGLKNVDLYKEKDTRVKVLSGGQKRKLSIAIAMIGDPKEDDSTFETTEFTEDATHNQLEEGRDNPLENVTPHFETTQNLSFIENENELWSMQFWMLCKIRYIRIIRNISILILRIVIPVVFIITGHLARMNVKPPTSVPLNMRVAAEHYARVIGGDSRINPLLIKDSVGTAESTVLMDFLKSAFATDTYISANSSLLSMSSNHYLGVDLQNYVVSGSIFTSTIKALYNDSSIHSLPAIISLFSNTLLQTAANISSKTSGLSVSASSLPWPPAVGDTRHIYRNPYVFLSVVFLASSFSLLSSLSAVELSEDRQKKMWNLLRVSGITKKMYWTAYLFVDFLMFCVPVLLSISLTLAFEVDDSKSAGAVLSMLTLFITIIPSSVLFSYSVSCASSIITVVITYIVFGIIPYTTLMLADKFSDADTAAVLHYVFCVLFGPYHMFGGFHYIHQVQHRHKYIYRPENKDISVGDYFSAPIYVTFLMAILHSVILAIQLGILDIRSIVGDMADALPCLSENRTKNLDENRDDIKDEDVIAEKQRVQHLLSSDQNTVGTVENLRKEFKNAKRVAVRNCTFAVDTGEIFGLLGPNGAGKTTILKMMTAELKPTNGKVSIGGYDSTRSSLSDAFKVLGYCPEYNALWERITLEEHLECYAAIRGIPKKNVKPVIDFFMKNIKVDEHARKRVSSLSGGTKRKLSYIITMLGQIKILLLDEPSTGMDPKSKRFLWDTIRRHIIGSNKGTILTSHSMEEADALCSRVAIMVNGKIECIGTTQHLKEKYGSGYLMEVKMRLSGSESEEEIEVRMDTLDKHLKSLFPGCSALERFGEMAQYEIPKDTVNSLGQTFKVLEDAKRIYGLEEYSFSQPTLEQVFIKFVKKQVKEGALESCRHSIQGLNVAVV